MDYPYNILVMFTCQITTSFDSACTCKITNCVCRYCGMHVTDPEADPSRNRQIMMIQRCDLDAEGLFTSWQFVTPQDDRGKDHMGNL